MIGKIIKNKYQKNTDHNAINELKLRINGQGSDSNEELVKKLESMLYKSPFLYSFFSF